MTRKAADADDDTRHEQQTDLEKLAAELRPHGCKTILTASENRLPYLDVFNPQAPLLSGRIYASADNFWWSHAEPIASRDNIPAAARAITRTLATR